MNRFSVSGVEAMLSQGVERISSRDFSHPFSCQVSLSTAEPQLTMACYASDILSCNKQFLPCNKWTRVPYRLVSSCLRKWLEEEVLTRHVSMPLCPLIFRLWTKSIHVNSRWIKTYLTFAFHRTLWNCECHWHQIINMYVYHTALFLTKLYYSEEAETLQVYQVRVVWSGYKTWLSQARNIK